MFTIKYIMEHEMIANLEYRVRAYKKISYTYNKKEIGNIYLTHYYS